MKKIVLILLFLIATTSISAVAETSLYEITKGDQKIYLGGTIHVLRDSDYPLPAEYEQAYESSRVLVLETDLQKSNSPEFGKKMAQVFLYGEGKSLSGDLQPTLWKELQSYADKNQFPLDQMSMFKAVFVGLTMSIMEMQKQGYGLGKGVDMYFFQKAAAAKKPILELESADDVLAHMRLLTNLDANQVIGSALRDVKRMDKVLDEALVYWRAGELNKLDKELAEPMREETPEVYQHLLIDRNQAWLPKIEQLFASKEVELVLVGALHLPGKEGLLSQLSARGYEVKPYQLNKK